MKKTASALVAFALATALLPMNANAAEQVANVEKVAPHAADQILVKVKAGKDLKSLAKKHGAGEIKGLGNNEWKLVKVPNGKAAEFVEKFLQDGDVAEAELDYIVHVNATPNDPSYSAQWHLPKINWNYTGLTHTSKTIAVIDTGVDLNHPDLSGKFVAGYDFVNNDTVAQDDQGHGTFVAGIAAAKTNNLTDIAGVDWNAKIMPVKVFNATGSGTVSAVIQGVDFAANNGAKVINLSLGGGAYSSAFQTAINNAWNKGAIIVAAAGGSGTTTQQYPAAYANVVSVASTTSTDAKASNTSYGTWVDVAAPGQGIVSLKMGGGTTTMSGSSFATAIVSGMASAFASQNTTASNTTIINTIFNKCVAIPGTGTYWTYGRVSF